MASARHNATSLPIRGGSWREMRGTGRGHGGTRPQKPGLATEMQRFAPPNTKGAVARRRAGTLDSGDEERRHADDGERCSAGGGPHPQPRHTDARAQGENGGGTLGEREQSIRNEKTHHSPTRAAIALAQIPRYQSDGSERKTGTHDVRGITSTRRSDPRREESGCGFFFRCRDGELRGQLRAASRSDASRANWCRGASLKSWALAVKKNSELDLQCEEGSDTA
ncbi:hypothetical protein DFH09DRAFT_1432628 [Mycena vulgaris]|nr:hypothetical protein DFH09DRAFT_1432628 [Mycena vulgaris]